MKIHLNNPLRSCRWLLSLVGPAMLAVSATTQAASVNWTVSINPKNSGTVAWSTTAPVANGVLTQSGKITFDQYSFVDLTFHPNAGGSIVKVMKNADDVTLWLDPSNHIQFGPVGSPHLISVTFAGGAAPSAPTGTFGFAFPTNNASLTAIADVTGNYSGAANFTIPRNYNIDVAQDESGKLAYIGTIDGFTPTGGGELAGGVGAVTTVNGKPTAQLQGSFAGTRDGVATTGSGTATGPLEISNVGTGTSGVTGTASYKAKVAGVPASESNVPIAMPVTPAERANLHKNWSLSLTITNIPTSTGKAVIMATAQLTLPNGNVIVYPLKKTKYSSTAGYKLSFKKGQNISVIPTALDKRSTITITGMMLTPSGGTSYTPTGGTLTYQFLGQSGTGNLTDFLVE
ncbi:MAG: hypothetical protein PCFJNLEI_03287 [Verrucomicrobiae bacterium]|nr:hypothetical protein [Verrucomicrobiae bacterium]